MTDQNISHMPELTEKESVHARLNDMVRLFTNGNKSAFGRQVDIQSGVLADLLGGRLNKPSFDVLLRLLSGYPQIREEWLLFGRGDMLKENYNPRLLEFHLSAARMLLDEQLASTEIESFDKKIKDLRTVLASLESLEPALESVQNGLFADVDQNIAQSYHQVIEELEDNIEATKEIRSHYLDKKNPTTAVSASLEPVAKGFIELNNLKGQRILLSIASISHAYAHSNGASGTVIELLTMNGGENVIIDTPLTYAEVKALIRSASR